MSDDKWICAYCGTENDDEYSGPSGSASSNMRFLNGDLGMLRKFNDINPKDFQIYVGIGLHMAEVYEEHQSAHHKQQQ